VKAARILLRWVVFGVSAATALGQTTFYWTGVGSTRFQDNATPTYNGTDQLIFLGGHVNKTVYLNGSPAVDSILILSDETYLFKPASGSLTLSIASGALVSSSNLGRLQFDSNIDLNLSGSSAVFDAGNGTIIVPGHITGNTPLTLTASGATGGAFIFNNTDTGNSYLGPTTLYSASGGLLTVAFWNSSPFGTGTVQVLSSSDLIAHGTQTVANNFVFNAPSTSNTIYLKSWDAPLTYSGSITLSANTTLVAQGPLSHVAAPDNTGSYPMPGAAPRNPIVFTGSISGASSLTVGGVGLVILNPSGSNTNTYSGGTTVNGSLVFGNVNAIPATGSILVNNTGYVGFGDTGNFTTELTHVASSSTGAVGIDTLPGASSTATLNNLDLSSFSSSSIRIGTATSAILTGTITPKGNNYQFGNGGGTLYVQSDLPNIASGSQVVLNSGSTGGLVSPLKLVLQGSLGYTGGTVSNNGFIIFDSGGLPSGTLTAAGSSVNLGNSYISVTNWVDTSSSYYLSLFDKTNTWGIVGFDTRASDSSAATFSGINLTGFNNGVLLGTSSRAIFGGTLTPTADNVLRLTAGNGGTLTVNSDLTGGVSLELGSPSTTQAFSDGTVVLNPATANTYTGGTYLNTNGPLTLTVGGTTPLGTGALTLRAGAGSPVGLQAVSSTYTLANDIVFATPGSTKTAGRLVLNGGNGITLSGAISGPGSLSVVNSHATLSHDNNGFSGDINLLNGTLSLADNAAAGTGAIYFNSSSDVVRFIGAATAPILYGIKGNSGTLDVGNVATLTFDTSNPNNPHEFGGSITAEIAPATAVIVTAGAPQPNAEQNGLVLSGNNTYTGGTTVTAYGLLGLSSNSAAGTGTITLNAPEGGLALNQGVTLTNALTFTSGALAGFGTFAPSNLTSITFGANQKIMPGVPDFSENPAGTLTLATDVVFADGGTYAWSLQDVARADGFSQLVINGNLSITATGGGFTLELGSFDLLGDRGYADLTYGQTYSFVIATTTGAITGFNPAAFTIDSTNFNSGLLTGTQYTLSATGNTLVLSFTAVPEPSAWALLLAGSGVLGLAAWRRRNR
jgi:fibronectin-binding autotransporter adhesin